MISSEIPSPTLSVVIPVYNEEEAVGELCSRVLAACGRIGLPFELVVINDGSVDGTLSRLIELSRSHPELLVLDLSRNFGHMAALHAGLTCARGEAVVVLDGDLQDPPELIPELVARWRDGADVVYGLRASRGEGLFLRWLTSAFYRLLRLAARIEIPAQAGTYCLLSRKSVEILIHQVPERSRYFAGLRAWLGGRQDRVTYQRLPRKAGQSRVGLRGWSSLARRAFIGFSYLPLRVSSLFSLLGSLAFLLVGGATVVLRLATPRPVPGWASTMTLVGFLAFTQSVVLFFICEYVAVLYDEVKRRPLSLIRSRIQGGKRMEG
jgi:dolichol-phosphate mannosyltransferase